MVLLTAHDFCQADFALKEKFVFLAQWNPNCLAKETPDEQMKTGMRRPPRTRRIPQNHKEGIRLRLATVRGQEGFQGPQSAAKVATAQKAS
jgi:hypothetical protein